MGDLITRAVELLPPGIRRRVRAAERRWLLALGRRRRSSVRTPRMGDLRRTEPFSRRWGNDRGRSVDRYYIDRFLASHAADIRGRTLEVANRAYTDRFGTGVEVADVLHVEEGNPMATIVGDLADETTLPANSFDCFILTQTLQSIYDVRAAVRTVHRILAPGGVVLASVPGISQIVHPDYETWGDYWRFTAHAVERLFSEAGFAPGDLEVRVHGNVLAATAFLYGLASRELTAHELDVDDSDNYQLLITVRGVKR